jgi:predicted O-methyltransferase YrrM
MSFIWKAKRIIKDEGLLSFLRIAGLTSVQFVASPYLSRKLRATTKDTELDELADIAFHGSLSIIEPFQIEDEILELLKLLKTREPKNIIEIGTARGGTLFLFSRVTTDDANIVSIDLMSEKSGGGYPKWKATLYRSFALQDQQIHLLNEDSHEKATRIKVEKILAGEKVDFIFIDGDHSYNGVKRDFELYSPLVRKDGIIAFHDIAKPVPGSVEGVYKFWQEIIQNHEYKEIIKDVNQGWAGIGLLYK